MKKKKKIIFIISGVVAFLVAGWIFIPRIFYYQIYGENYDQINYVSTAGFEAMFPATPFEYGDIASVRDRQIQYYSTMIEMKDRAVYYVDYITFPLNDITIDETFVKDLVITTNDLYGDYSLIVTPAEPYSNILRYEIEYHDDADNMKSLAFFDPTYEAFYVVGVWQPVKKDINSEAVTSFISSFKLTYLDEADALTQFYSNLETDNENLKNQLANNSQSYQNQISKLKSEVQSLGTAPSTNLYTKAEASSFWSQYTVKLSCNFAGEFIAEGSGLLIEDGVITNAHVFTEEVDGVLYGPDYCTISSPKLSGSVTVEFDPDDYLTVDGVDFGEILISNPTSQMRGLMDDGVLDKMCDPQNVAIGDEMIVLGYPYTGSTQSVTVTDGIVSGFENNFYVTSTKIEHGNSGGVAVLIKDNCYLGVPTFVASGELESLGRILDVYSFFYY
jgi:hypothetical protein